MKMLWTDYLSALARVRGLAKPVCFLRLLAALLITLATAYSAELPAPTGPYPVGRTIRHWTDPSRRTPGQALVRPLNASIYYPADAHAEAKPAPYISEFELIKRAGVLSQKEAELLATTRPHCILDPPLANSTGSFPVVVFSPGNTMNAAMYSCLLEELASHGFIVAALDHPGEARAFVTEELAVIKYAEEKPASGARPFENIAREKIAGRVQDIAFALKKLTELNVQQDSRFHDRIKVGASGLFGHSMGGIAAAQAASELPDIAASLNMDGALGTLPFIPDSAGKGPARPFMLLAKPFLEPTAEELKRLGMSKEKVIAARSKVAEHINELMASTPAEKYRVTIARARHNSFSDELLLAGEPGAKERLAITRAMLLAFFQKHLVHASSPLLDGPNQSADYDLKRFPTAQ